MSPFIPPLHSQWKSHSTDRGFTLTPFPGATHVTTCRGGALVEKPGRFFSFPSDTSSQHKRLLLLCKTRTSLTRRGGAFLWRPGMLSKTWARKTSPPITYIKSVIDTFELILLTCMVNFLCFVFYCLRDGWIRLFRSVMIRDRRLLWRNFRNVKGEKGGGNIWML